MPRSLALLLLPLALLAACDDATEPTASGGSQAASAVSQARTLAEIRAGTARFQQVETAVAEGYVAVSPCVSHAPAGAMGVHYLNVDLLDGVVDPARPELLLYEPQADGGLRLVGVEFMVAAAAWDATRTGVPTLAGQAFDDHRAEATRHGIPIPHYDLHAWVWRHNPSGMFAHFNPKVACPS